MLVTVPDRNEIIWNSWKCRIDFFQERVKPKMCNIDPELFFAFRGERSRAFPNP